MGMLEADMRVCVCAWIEPINDVRHLLNQQRPYFAPQRTNIAVLSYGPLRVFEGAEYTQDSQNC